MCIYIDFCVASINCTHIILIISEIKGAIKYIERILLSEKDMLFLV